MTGHQCLALMLLEKGLLNPSTVRKLLDGSSPMELVLEVLMIVSDLARMDKARHNIISLLIDRRVDFACFAICNAAFPYNLLYEELRRSIPLLMCCFRQRKTLIRLLANRLPNVPQQFDGTKDVVGFSPTGIVWMVSSIFRCLSSGTLSFREVLVRMEHVKIMSALISEVHLKILKCWSEPGGGNDGVRDVINPVIDLLAFPFLPVQDVCGLPSAIYRGFLLNMMGSPGGRLGMEDKDMVKLIESNMPEYIKILCEVGKPGCTCTCLDQAELKNLGRPVAFLAKVTGHQFLALKSLEKGLLNPSTVRKLLDGSSPRELVLEVLMIVSDLARMDKVRHNIISLLIDRRVDFACFAIGNAAFLCNLLYEELRRSIPLLMCCTFSSEEDKTKSNAACSLIASVKILSLKEPCRLC